MARIIFITGGARSGKSRLAEKLAESFGGPLCYVATGEARDAEMAQRIAAHKARRGEIWQTIEEPCNLSQILTGTDGKFRAVLVDCITLWISNLLLQHLEPEPVLEQVQALLESAKDSTVPLIFVSNEVGMGIVPENALARTFRDLAGRANELLAAAADEVYVTFSGIPLRLK
ncbi:MAG: bifunctional adenosylcobinamide kinase/adenosylcobinamide-phosphate guanylyltransferase [Geobacteraceae bacterium]|nr:bifunctional adenosylcobinamide kinase/adenosylcobinamide-phosphate guanylyltransferase [Geobacteraceae bacterium]